jgi:hypothetical protein
MVTATDLIRLMERWSGIVRYLDVTIWNTELSWDNYWIDKKARDLRISMTRSKQRLPLPRLKYWKPGKRNEAHLIPEHKLLYYKPSQKDMVSMSWLNYVLTGVSIIAIIYSYAVGSATGVIIWAIVLGLNVALVLVERSKARKLM